MNYEQDRARRTRQQKDARLQERMVDIPICKDPERRRRCEADTKEWFKKRGLKRVEISVLKRNPISSKFWDKMGFDTYLERRFKKI